MELGRSRKPAWSRLSSDDDQDVMNSNRVPIVPSLHHRKEGWLRHQKDFAQQPNPTQPGWFSLLVTIGTPPRLRYRRLRRNIFLIAQPSLLAVMQGGDYRAPDDSHGLTNGRS